MKKEKPQKRTSIGGQAVLEGVMMKGERSLATAVRTENGEITIESKHIKSVKEKSVIFRLPFVRGVVNLCTQLFQGTGILMRSAEVYGDFAEPSKAEKWMAEKLKINPMNLLMAFSVVLGLALAIGLFVFLPNFLTGLIFEIPALANVHPALQSLSEGLFMLTIFVLYILTVSLMKDIRRVFMYHGAEHKVISCFEHGLDLTVENAKKMSREHSRCGTTFMFFVVAVSILVFALVNWVLSLLGWLSDNNIVNAFIKLGAKLVFLPLVAGISYEILKLLAKSDCVVVRILRYPGMMLQKLTTKEPTDDMLEVSIAAFLTVLEMDADPNMADKKFDIKMPYPIARKKIGEALETADQSDLDWMFCEATGKLRSELRLITHLSAEEYDRVQKIASKMKGGEPLQYALGNAEFFGLRLAVNESVLIPRPETELLAEKAIQLVMAQTEKSIQLEQSQAEKAIQLVMAQTEKSIQLVRTQTEKSIQLEQSQAEKSIQVLDLCTGSGAIAIVVAKNTICEMTATDISENALVIASANALTNGVKINFLCGNMFDAIGKNQFDLILANPPYIPTSDIAKLSDRVKKFEPILALDGGTDGLDFYRIIAKEFETHLTDTGVLLMEFGIGQAKSMLEIFGGYNVEIVKDMEGIDRMALVTKK